MNVSSIIVLTIVLLCFILAVKNIKKKDSNGCTGMCGHCSNSKLCNNQKK